MCAWVVFLILQEFICSQMRCYLDSKHMQKLGSGFECFYTKKGVCGQLNWISLNNRAFLWNNEEKRHFSFSGGWDLLPPAPHVAGTRADMEILGTAKLTCADPAEHLQNERLKFSATVSLCWTIILSCWKQENLWAGWLRGLGFPWLNCKGNQSGFYYYGKENCVTALLL